VNGPDHVIQPFAQNRVAGTGIVGLTWNINNQWNVKVNAASGLRAPNLAELSSNGLHEGTNNYEIGDPTLKNEQNINTDLIISYGSKYARVALSGFYNHFFSYIYLQRTGELYLVFPVYRYMQQDAFLTGGEFEYEITPQGKVKGLTWSQSVAGLVGKTKDGGYLPYIAPPKISSTIRYEHKVSKKITNMFGSVSFDYVFEQNHLGPFETKTDAYKLVNASFGLDIAVKRGSVRLSVIGNNLLGEVYVDHLSRLKNLTDYYTPPHQHIYNIGRNIMLNLGVPLNFDYHKNKKQS
jgi:iron complex outermembrane receptor protein